MKPSKIHPALFPYGGTIGAKVRCVLALTGYVGSVPEVLVAYISSILPSPLLATDILIDPTNPDHAQTQLRTVSVLRLHKLATVHKSNFVRLLGSVSPKTWTEVEPKLRLLLNL